MKSFLHRPNRTIPMERSGVYYYMVGHPEGIPRLVYTGVVSNPSFGFQLMRISLIQSINEWRNFMYLPTPLIRLE